MAPQPPKKSRRPRKASGNAARRKGTARGSRAKSAATAQPASRSRLAKGLLYCLVLGSPLLIWISVEVARLPDVKRLAIENPKTTAMIRFRLDQAARQGSEEPRVVQFWVPLEQISKILAQAVQASEDDRFYEHGGFDFQAIRGALRANVQTGFSSRGGSTITQQLAKNLYLSPERTILRKAREAAVALRLERDLGKERILEVYLNIIEMGKGVFGVEAAARKYFRKSASQVEAHEAVLLATAIPAPLTRDPGCPSSGHRRLAKNLLYRLKVKGCIDTQAYVQAGSRLEGISCRK